jgi:hypothetical protein
MPAIQEPTSGAFAETFRDVIRIGFNWDRFFEEKWPIEVVSLDSPSSLARCFMPWYIGPKGDEVAYDDPDAVPMRLIDVPKAIKILNAERRADLLEYVDSFQNQKGVIKFSAPTYALPDDHYFILDRNHRLSALTMTPAPFEVTLLNVRGPLDSECLLDLIHWLPPRKT